MRDLGNWFDISLRTCLSWCGGAKNVKMTFSFSSKRRAAKIQRGRVWPKKTRLGYVRRPHSTNTNRTRKEVPVRGGRRY